MPRLIATALYTIGIVGLFALDRQAREQISRGLWVAFAWLFFELSKSPSLWFQSDSPASYGGGYNLESNPINAATFAAIILSGVIVLAMRANRVGQCLRANWPILLFYGYCALSCVWSDYSDAVFKKWIRCLGDPIMVLIVLTELDPIAALNRLYARLGFVLLPLSVLYIKYYPEIGRAYTNSWEYMYRGVTDHKNTLGSVCLVLGLGFLWRFLEHWQNKADANRRRHLIADTVVLSIVVWLLSIANSATSSMCFVSGVVIILACRVRMVRRTPVALHLMILGLVAVPAYAAYFQRDLVTVVGRNPTLTGRTDLWKQCLSISGNPLVGTGFESFWLGWRIQKIWEWNPGIRLNEAHNGYLEMYLQLGWCGAIILAIIVARSYPRLARGIRSDVTLGPVMLAYIVAALNYNHSEAGFRVQSSVWAFFLLAAMFAPLLANRADAPLQKGIRLDDRRLAPSDRDSSRRETSEVPRSGGWNWRQRKSIA
jgi:hypothetical protein